VIMHVFDQRPRW